MPQAAATLIKSKRQLARRALPSCPGWLCSAHSFSSEISIFHPPKISSGRCCQGRKWVPDARRGFAGIWSCPRKWKTEAGCQREASPKRGSASCCSQRGSQTLRRSTAEAAGKGLARSRQRAPGVPLWSGKTELAAGGFKPVCAVPAKEQTLGRPQRGDANKTATNLSRPPPRNPREGAKRPDVDASPRPARVTGRPGPHDPCPPPGQEQPQPGSPRASGVDGPAKGSAL